MSIRWSVTGPDPAPHPLKWGNSNAAASRRWIERIVKAPRAVPLAILVLLTLIGCTADQGQEPPELRPASLEAVRTLELDKSDSAYIGEIVSHASVDFGPAGDLVIGDRMSSRVLRFTPNGALAAIAGRGGEGPGEYEGIWGVGWETEDRIWILDANRTSRLDSALSLVDMRTFQSEPWPQEVQFTGGKAVVGTYHSSNQGNALQIRPGSGGEPLGSLLPYGPLSQEPYVLGEYRPVFRVVGDTVIGGSTVTYPHKIMNLDGEILAEFGRPPPSVGEMRVPAFAEFAVDIRAGNLWQRSFGTTSSMWVVHDSLIVVEHRRPHPEMGGIPVATYRADIYDRWTLAKLAEDMELPGRIMAWHDDLLWILTDSPPAPWTFTGFEVRVQ